MILTAHSPNENNYVSCKICNLLVFFLGVAQHHSTTNDTFKCVYELVSRRHEVLNARWGESLKVPLSLHVRETSFPFSLSPDICFVTSWQ